MSIPLFHIETKCTCFYIEPAVVVVNLKALQLFAVANTLLPNLNLAPTAD